MLMTVFGGSIGTITLLTTGFNKYKEKDINIENKYDSIYNESMKYYNYLKQF